MDEFELKPTDTPRTPESLECDVCGEPAIGVASSSLGAISFAYCRRCVMVNAEPYGMLVGVLAMNGGRSEMAPWVANVVSGTLSVVGKTVEELDNDVKVEEERFWREMIEMDATTKEGDK